MENYLKVKNYVTELGYTISYSSEEEGIIVIQHKDAGINRLVLGIAEPLLIVEQFIIELNNASQETLVKLLQKNRDMIHGAFVLDESGSKLIFRDTLQIESLDINEIEATIYSLTLLLSEYSDEIISFSKL